MQILYIFCGQEVLPNFSDHLKLLKQQWCGDEFALAWYYCTMSRSAWQYIYDDKLCTVLFRIARAGIFPRSSLLGGGQLGFWEMGGVGQLGEGWSKRGQFTSNLRGRWTIPVTAGGCQVSRRGHKGEQRGARGISKRESGEMRHVYMQLCCMCKWTIERWMIIIIVYIIITRMNVVDNLNSV
jgi:hypothetical protein